MKQHCCDIDDGCNASNEESDASCDCDCDCCSKLCVEECITFDKFMDDILIKESKKNTMQCADTPQRKYIKKYRELSQNLIKFGGK